MKYFSFIIIGLFLFQTTQSQSFSKINISIITTDQIIPENYYTIILPAGIDGEPQFNQFDINNADTHLQLIADNKGKRYHILLQTNFMGKITYLSVSNNLSAVFNNKEKPKLIFESCIQDVNTFISPQQNIDAAVNCVLERLSYCSN